MAASMEPLHTPVGSSHLGRPSLMAKYASLPDVRQAIDVLESQGVDGDNLTIVGSSGDLPQGTDRRRTDSRFLRHTLLYLAIGVLGGALVGAAIGAALIGLVLLVWSGLEASGWVFTLLTLWFAVGGAVLGCFVAVSRGRRVLRVVAARRSRTRPRVRSGWRCSRTSTTPSSSRSRTDALEIVPDPEPVQPR